MIFSATAKRSLSLYSDLNFFTKFTWQDTGLKEIILLACCSAAFSNFAQIAFPQIAHGKVV